MEPDWLPNIADLKQEITGTPWTRGVNEPIKPWEYVIGKSIFEHCAWQVYTRETPGSMRIGIRPAK